MKIVSLIIQIVVALGLFNVWLVRFHKPTPYRPGNARTMSEEFAAYGLPKWTLWIVGAGKLTCAACLIAGIWVPVLVAPAAIVVSALMLGAIAMHLKVRDPLIKSVPACTVLVLTAFILANAIRGMA